MFSGISDVDDVTDSVLLTRGAPAPKRDSWSLGAERTEEDGDGDGDGDKERADIDALVTSISWSVIPICPTFSATGRVINIRIPTIGTLNALFVFMSYLQTQNSSGSFGVHKPVCVAEVKEQQMDCFQHHCCPLLCGEFVMVEEKSILFPLP